MAEFLIFDGASFALKAVLKMGMEAAGQRGAGIWRILFSRNTSG